MIEYGTVLILILLTFLTAVVNVKIPIFGYIVIVIDLFTLLPEPITSGSVIVGYSYANSVVTPIMQSFSWLPIVIILGIVFSAFTAILKTVGSI